MKRSLARRFGPRLLPSLLLGLAAAGCGSSNNGGPSTTAAAVAGAADTHCGTAGNMTVRTVGICYTNDAPTSTTACGVDFQPDTGAGAGDAGAPPDDGGATGDLGATLYNATGFDDDCKYAVSWTATPVTVNANVTFTVTVTRLSDGMPAHCAGVGAEPFIGNTPAIPTTGAAEIGASGTYNVGPIKFTQSGMWTVRFHFYEECSDSNDDSPHGHAAFYVNVP
jgi:hypothetical protein